MSTLIRPRLYAIITAIEQDLRNIIRREVLTQSSFKEAVGDDAYKKAKDRYKKEENLEKGEIDENLLVEFLDFKDCIHTLNRNKSVFYKERNDFLKNINEILEPVATIRNRVMHARPLETDDLQIINNISNELKKSYKSDFYEHNEICKKLKSKSGFLLGINIPKEDSVDKVYHNLPIPDFEETGFVGRGDDIKEIRKKIYGAFPVITLFGIGGIGKTALALKVAYSLLDDAECPFEAIIWVTSKTTKLGVSEIIDIKDAITSSLSMFDEIGKTLGTNPDNNIEEIIEYMNLLPILLIIDNLETVLDERIKNFIKEVPNGSKIIITSRRSVGAYDAPYKMKNMDERESVRLMRLLSNNHSVRYLAESSQGKLTGYVKKMENNPGWIKWFVNAVASGETPENLIANRKIFLRFCVKNVYNYLSETAKSILDVMLSLTNAHSISSLHYYSNVEMVKLEQAILDLHSCNMIEMQTRNDATVYVLSYIPGLYLKNYHKPKKSFFDSMQKKRKEISGRTQGLEYDHKQRPYSTDTVYVMDTSYKVVAKYLFDSIKLIKKGNLESAKKSIALAKEVESDYFEAHRVEAMLLTEQGDFLEARESYELAIRLKQDYPPLRLWFGKFLRKQEVDDLDEAVNQLQAGKEFSESTAKKFLAPDEFGCELATVFIYMKNFDGADQELRLLEETKNNYRPHMQKIIVETRLMWYRRYGEHCVDQRDFESGIENFEKLHCHYQNMPPEFRKNPINQKQVVLVLPRLNQAVRVVHKNSPPENLIQLVNEIMLIKKAYEYNIGK